MRLIIYIFLLLFGIFSNVSFATVKPVERSSIFKQSQVYQNSFLIEKINPSINDFDEKMGKYNMVKNNHPFVVLFLELLGLVSIIASICLNVIFLKNYEEQDNSLYLNLVFYFGFPLFLFSVFCVPTLIGLEIEKIMLM